MDCGDLHVFRSREILNVGKVRVWPAIAAIAPAVQLGVYGGRQTLERGCVTAAPGLEHAGRGNRGEILSHHWRNYVIVIAQPQILSAVCRQRVNVVDSLGLVKQA